MSILIYHDKSTASTAAATLIAAQLIKDPSTVIGFDFDDELLSLYSSLTAMTVNGLIDWRLVHLVQLFEFVKNDALCSISDTMRNVFLKDTNFSAEHLIRPDSESGNWQVSCQKFENTILHSGGMDLALLRIKEDGSFLYNLSHSDAVPVTHVETAEGTKVITAGITTVMMAKKLVVLVTGKACADAAASALKGTISEALPASFLQLHGDVTFLLDEDAASLL